MTACCESATTQGAPPPSLVTSASIDFVYATREQSDNHVIIEDTITGDTILDSNQFDFDWEPGVDARLNLASGNYGVGFRFFGGFEFNDTAKVTTSPIWNFPTNPPLFGLGTADVTSQYDSSLDSVELNAARLFGDNGAVFIGLRGIVVDEKLKNFALAVTSPPSPSRPTPPPSVRNWAASFTSAIGSLSRAMAGSVRSPAAPTSALASSKPSARRLQPMEAPEIG
jgi:hypothetical protein